MRLHRSLNSDFSLIIRFAMHLIDENDHCENSVWYKVADYLFDYDFDVNKRLQNLYFYTHLMKRDISIRNKIKQNNLDVYKLKTAKQRKKDKMFQEVCANLTSFVVDNPNFSISRLVSMPKLQKLTITLARPLTLVELTFVVNTLKNLTELNVHLLNSYNEADIREALGPMKSRPATASPQESKPQCNIQLNNLVFGDEYTPKNMQIKGTAISSATWVEILSSGCIITRIGKSATPGSPVCIDVPDMKLYPTDYSKVEIRMGNIGDVKVFTNGYHRMNPFYASADKMKLEGFTKVSDTLWGMHVLVPRKESDFVDHATLRHYKKRTESITMKTDFAFGLGSFKTKLVASKCNEDGYVTLPFCSDDTTFYCDKAVDVHILDNNIMVYCDGTKGLRFST